MGAAALMSAQGGEQEALQRAITNKAVNEINTQQGMADVNALANLRNQWSGEFQGGLNREQDWNKFANSLYLQSLGMKYPQAFQSYYPGFGRTAATMALGTALGHGSNVASDYGLG
jgi:hypothetical protein